MIQFAINNYVFNLLQKQLGWSKVDQKTPIIPRQQQPEFMNFKKPFIVYGSSNEYNSGELEALGSSTIHYLIYGQSEEVVDRAIEQIHDAFTAFNSAENINGWIRYPDNEIVDELRTMVITSTEAMNTISAGGTDEEGGWKDGMVSVRVGYKTRIDPVAFDLIPRDNDGNPI